MKDKSKKRKRLQPDILSKDNTDELVNNVNFKNLKKGQKDEIVCSGNAEIPILKSKKNKKNKSKYKIKAMEECAEKTVEDKLIIKDREILGKDQILPHLENKKNDSKKSKRKEKTKAVYELTTNAKNTDDAQITKATVICGDPDELQILKKLKKKHKKRKNKRKDEKTVENIEPVVEIGIVETTSKEKGKRKYSIASMEPVVTSPDDDTIPKKRKKKKKDQEICDVSPSQIQKNESKKSSKKKTEENISIDSTPVSVDSFSECDGEKLKSSRKSKKRKKQDKQKDTVGVSDQLVSDSNIDRPFKKGTPNKDKHYTSVSTGRSSDDKNDTKKTKSDKALENTVLGSTSSDGKRRILNKSNMDEISQPNLGNFGQWGLNSFVENETQNKFLRLMGGMKKRSDGEKPGFAALKTGSLISGHPKSNMALSQHKASSLNKALEEQYEKALDLKLNTDRCSGLGYAPPPSKGKKFYIDSRKTSSRKFAD